MTVTIKGSDFMLLMDVIPRIVELGKDKNDFFAQLQTRMYSQIQLVNAFSVNSIDIDLNLSYSDAMDLSSLSLYARELGMYL